MNTIVADVNNADPVSCGSGDTDAVERPPTDHAGDADSEAHTEASPTDAVEIRAFDAAVAMEIVPDVNNADPVSCGSGDTEDSEAQKCEAGLDGTATDAVRPSKPKKYSSKKITADSKRADSLFSSTSLTRSSGKKERIQSEQAKSFTTCVTPSTSASASITPRVTRRTVGKSERKTKL